MQKFFCDRCRAELPEFSYIRLDVSSTLGITNNYIETIHVCENCKKVFLDFIRGFLNND